MPDILSAFYVGLWSSFKQGVLDDIGGLLLHQDIQRNNSQELGVKSMSYAKSGSNAKEHGLEIMCFPYLLSVILLRNIFV